MKDENAGCFVCSKVEKSLSKERFRVINVAALVRKRGIVKIPTFLM